MGRKSASETVIAIYQAFLSTRTWRQNELATHVGVQTHRLRKILAELTTAGVPLDREEEHPHVYWSVPKGWFPGGVLFAQDELSLLLRSLAQLPRTEERARLMVAVSKGLDAAAAEIPRVIAAPNEETNGCLSILERAAAEGCAIRCRYFSASRGSIDWRHLSIHRLQATDRTRVVATCHRRDELRWFRADRFIEAKLDPNEAHRRAEEVAVDAFIEDSLGGFNQTGERQEHRFFVADPEARWVQLNLLPGMQATQVDGGIRVSAETASVLRLARYVVALGGAARPESQALGCLVAELANGALENTKGVGAR